MKKTATNQMKLTFVLMPLLAMGLMQGSDSVSAAPNAGEQAIEQLRVAGPASRPGQSATLLPDGRWLLLGGIGADQRPTRDGALVVGATGETAAQVEMTLARSGHTATVLPDGRVLILGGVGEDGRVMAASETFDVDKLSFALAPEIDLLPRAFHSTTLLTDGRLLIAGGIGANGTVLDDAEVFNPLDDRVEWFNAKLEAARYGHLVTLLPSAPVLVWGGLNPEHEPLQSGELFDPESRRFASVDTYNATLLPQAGDQLATPGVAAMIPVHGAVNVPVDQIISVRFSKPIHVETLDEQSVTLLGPTGAVPVDVVPAEAGLLVFVTPTEELLPKSTYTLFIRGATDNDAVNLPFTAMAFTTAALGATAPVSSSRTAPSTPTRVGAPPFATQPGTSRSSQAGNSTGSSALDGQSSRANTARGKTGETTPSVTSIPDPDEEWIPGATEYRTGNWITNRPISSFAGEPRAAGFLPKSASTATALSGLVLKLNDKPLSGVTLRVGQRTAQTSSDGTFLLEDVAAGWQTLVIDATTVGPDYGYFEALVHIEPGTTTALPYAIWTPKLDRTHAVRIPSPTLSEVVLTTPRMPGFAVVIPPGVVIRDRAGKIVTELSITPIPIDRTPFPLPDIFEFDAFYTIQPAGATLQSLDGTPVKARVIYPNYANVPAGKRMLFWNHDPSLRGWHVYGEGQVSADAKTIVPAANVGIYQFSGFMVSTEGTPPPSTCPCGAPGDDGGGGGGGTPGAPYAGDPVNLATGSFIYAHTDLVVNDIVPLKLRRTYFSYDQAGSREFGQGMSAGLDYLLYNQAPTGLDGPIAHLGLTTPDGANIDLVCIQDCNYTRTGVFEGRTPGYFYKAVMTFSNANQNYPLQWTLTTKDGTKYVFYGNGGKIEYITDRYGNTTTFTRTPYVIGNLTSVVSPNGKSIELSYSGTIVTSARDNSGRTWTYAYSSNAMDATDPMGGNWHYTYDGFGQMLTVRDPRGNTVVTNEYYGGNGLVKKQTYADGSTTSYVWTFTPYPDDKVQQVDVTDQRGNVRRVVFNPTFYISSDTFALGKPESQTTTFSRDPTTNLLLSKTDPLGRVTTYTHDALGNTLTLTRLAGTSSAVTTTYTYESAFNQVATITDPLGHMSRYVYDAQGNAAQFVDANNNARTMTYTSQGQLAMVTDALSHSTAFTYIGGVKATTTDALGRTTVNTIDSLGRRVAVTDPLGNLTQIVYDPLDRRTSIIDPLGNSVRFAYDANGNVVSHTDRSGNQTTYAYDSMNRPISKQDSLSGVETYGYDVASKLTRMTDRKGQLTGFTYDNLNRQISVGFGATTANPTSFQRTIGYTLDAGNRLLQATDSINGAIVRSYDSLGRLIQEQTPQGVVSYTYDAAGRRTTMSVSGQQTVTYTYSNTNRLTSLQQGGQQISLTYDNADRRSQLNFPNSVQVSYSYDGADELIGVDYRNGSGVLGNLTYTYDASGRRLSVGGSLVATNLPNALPNASYNGNNQLIQWSGQSLAYDANGDLLSDGSKFYTWDAARQLVAINSSAGPIASYAYDALGRRKSKNLGGTTTEFVYDGLNFVQEKQNGSPYANLITGLARDEVFARVLQTSSEYFLLDAIATVIGVTDQSGSLTTTFQYEPYGNVSRTGSATTSSQRLAGREQDELTDLYYYRARYYAPTSGRFISEDPIGFRGGANLYGYVGQSPQMYRDPLGLNPFGCMYPLYCPPGNGPNGPPWWQDWPNSGVSPPMVGPGKYDCLKCDGEALGRCLAGLVFDFIPCAKLAACSENPQICAECAYALTEAAECFEKHCKKEEKCCS